MTSTTAWLATGKPTELVASQRSETGRVWSSPTSSLFTWIGVSLSIPMNPMAAVAARKRHDRVHFFSTLGKAPSLATRETRANSQGQALRGC